MNQVELQSLCVEAGESKFRGVQLFEWMYRHGIVSFDSMLNINKSFREHLKRNCIIQTLQVKRKMPSQKDESVKILFSTQDNNFIDSQIFLISNQVDK